MQAGARTVIDTPCLVRYTDGRGSYSLPFALVERVTARKVVVYADDMHRSLVSREWGVTPPPGGEVKYIFGQDDRVGPSRLYKLQVFEAARCGLVTMVYHGNVRFGTGRLVKSFTEYLRSLRYKCRALPHDEWCPPHPDLDHPYAVGIMQTAHNALARELLPDLPYQVRQVQERWD
jgi:hypothetical protein